MGGIRLIQHCKLFLNSGTISFYCVYRFLINCCHLYEFIFNESPQLPLPEYDQLGRRVVIMRSGCANPFIHKAEDVEKVSFMVIDTMGRTDEQFFIAGLVVIVDLEGFTLDHLTQKPLSVIKKQMKFLQVD